MKGLQLDCSIDCDRSFLQEYAESLYTRASVGIAIWTLAGGLVGFVANEAYVSAAARNGFGWLPSLVAGLIGLLIGWRRAFWIKLEAQRTLCQMMIEEHLEQLVSIETERQAEACPQFLSRS